MTAPMIRNKYGCDKCKTRLRNFEDTKGVIRSLESKDGQYNYQKKNDKQ